MQPYHGSNACFEAMVVSGDISCVDAKSGSDQLLARETKAHNESCQLLPGRHSVRIIIGCVIGYLDRLCRKVLRSTVNRVLLQDDRE
jgi:hypothetical protein